MNEITVAEAVRILTDRGVDGRTYERLQALQRAKTDDERKDARKALSDAQLRGGNQ